MRLLLFITLCVGSLSVLGQEKENKFDGHKWEAPYTLPIPKDWTVERFIIPPFFASQIEYKGVEDIRFAPGWSNVNADEYWTYAFLWYLDEKPEMKPNVIEKNLQAYYTGLIRINSDTSKMDNKKQVPVKAKFKAIKTFRGDLMTFTGTVEMLDYMQLKSITLNCIVHFKSCTDTNKTLLFYELSPKPFSHNVWLALDQLWADFRCTRD